MVMLSSSRAGRIDPGQHFSIGEQTRFRSGLNLCPVTNKIRVVRCRQRTADRWDLIALSAEAADLITRSGKAHGEMNKATM
jgi:hypothetical protein